PPNKMELWEHLKITIILRLIHQIHCYALASLILSVQHTIMASIHYVYNYSYKTQNFFEVLETTYTNKSVEMMIKLFKDIYAEPFEEQIRKHFDSLSLKDPFNPAKFDLVTKSALKDCQNLVGATLFENAYIANLGTLLTNIIDDHSLLELCINSQNSTKNISNLFDTYVSALNIESIASSNYYSIFVDILVPQARDYLCNKIGANYSERHKLVFNHNVVLTSEILPTQMFLYLNDKNLKNLLLYWSEECSNIYTQMLVIHHWPKFKSNVQCTSQKDKSNTRSESEDITESGQKQFGKEYLHSSIYKTIPFASLFPMLENFTNAETRKFYEEIKETFSMHLNTHAFLWELYENTIHKLESITKN
ncbi:unnamed protein product, partial [Gordionus sp. m RMFG-2023]